MERNWDRATLHAAAALAIVVFATFYGALGGEFVYDDHKIVANNPVIRTLDPVEHLTLAFWSRFESDYEYYRPATTWSLALDRAVHGEGPFGFHLTGLLLHVFSSLLVFRIVRRLGGALVGGAAAAIFAVHPVQTEAVVWVSARTDLLSTFFLLLALELQARLPERVTGRGLAGAAVQLLVLGAALLSKESAVTFPALLVGFEAARGRSAGKTWKELPGALVRRFAVTGPLCLLLIGGYLYLRFSVVGQLAGGLEAGEELWKNPLLTAPLAERLLTAVNIAGRYLVLLFFPASLSVDYYFNVVPVVESVASAAFLVPLIGVALFAWLALVLAGRSPAACFGLIAGAGAYSLISQTVIAAPIVMAERSLYGPMIGLAALLAAAAIHLIRRFAPADRTRVVVTAIAVPLLVTMCWRSHGRTADFEDEYSLFLATTRESPASAIGWNNLGAAQVNRGEMEAAIRSFERAAEIAPNNLRARLNVAKGLARTGDPGGAESRLRRMLQDFPEEDAEAIWVELAQQLSQRAAGLVSAGSTQEARRLYEEAATNAETYGGRSQVPEIKASLLLIAARASAVLNRLGRAERLFADAVAVVAPAEGDAGPLVSAGMRITVLREAADFHWRAGHHLDAARLWERAAPIAVAAGEPSEAARFYLRSGEALRVSGNKAEALSRFREAERLAAGDESLLSLARTAIARLDD